MFKRHLSKNQRRFFRALVRHQVIAVDFDGTLSLGKFPACGPANTVLLAYFKDLLAKPLDRRPYYVLWTSRTGINLENAVTWLLHQGIKFDGVNTCPSDKNGYTRKISADLYIDDRAITPESFIARISRNDPNKEEKE